MSLVIGTTVEVFKNRLLMGKAAGRKAEECILKCLEMKKDVRVIFAAAPSQNEMLSYLAASAAIDWKRITAFHMDEYIGLPRDMPQGFGNFLRERLFEKVPLKKVHYIDGSADPEAECERYGKLVTQRPVDVLLCGIGENGHIAFNDPPVADFADPLPVKVVTLERACRNQQVHDGCFASLDRVPKRAFTLTIPVLLSADYAVCTVPGVAKAQAVRHALRGPVSEKCPASILRLHRHCAFFLDAESGKAIF
ncbi:MAG: glucosamine-6-phosphate deaminase [Treponema sp.]|jgi:glucosamine-6-phosphate deaminase|nr:glucosamine-6-phosphate deaminase [Treponema sp.]